MSPDWIGNRDDRFSKICEHDAYKVSLDHDKILVKLPSCRYAMAYGSC